LNLPGTNPPRRNPLHGLWTPLSRTPRSLPGLDPDGPSASQLAWAAGFIDGEACVHIAKQRYVESRNPTFRLGVYITQNDRSTLEHLRECLGIDTPIHKVKAAPNHRRQCFTLNYTGIAALKVLHMLLPYLVRKRAEAEAAFAFWTDGNMGQPTRGKPVPADIVAVREHYFELMKQLK
jgi:hypothetical protein